MPTMVRICPRCGAKVKVGQGCACERDERPSASERGYGVRWQRARAAFLADHPVCVKCGAPATVVDHIFPHKGDQSVFWDKLNWQALCTHCHCSIKQAEERGKKKPKIIKGVDANGRPRDPNHPWNLNPWKP
ncbi:HNH endonuclease [Pararhodospirillum oryzae]|nr:HNH endonuclease signature motif containing protein [Pararhodospirillum oryzae]